MPSDVLPRDRVREALFFEVINNDLWGLHFLKDGRKCWVAPFSCAVLHVIHSVLMTSRN